MHSLIALIIAIHPIQPNIIAAGELEPVEEVKPIKRDKKKASYKVVEDYIGNRDYGIS